MQNVLQVSWSYKKLNKNPSESVSHFYESLAETMFHHGNSQNRHYNPGSGMIQN